MYPEPSEGHAISRDVFARFDVMKRRVYTWTMTCRWCGGKHHTPKGHPYLFQYGTNPDAGGGTYWQPEFFCSVSCMKSYNS